MLIALEKQRTSRANEGLVEQLDATQRAEALAKQQEDLANQQRKLADEHGQVAEKQRKLADEQRQLAIAQKEEAVRNLYVSQMRLAMEDWSFGQLPRLDEMLGRLSPPSRPT